MMTFVEQRSRPRGPLVAGVAAGLVVLVVVVAFILGGGNHKGGSPSKGGGETSTGPAKGTDKDATLTADNVTFSDVYGRQFPSAAAGPHDTRNGRAIGFDRSPAGAVLAAINIFARAESPPGPAVFEPTINEQVVGPDRDRLLEKAKTGYAEGAPRGTAPDGSLSAAIEEARPNRIGMWAYRVDAYDGSSATVNVLLRQLLPEGSYAYFNFPFTVRWLDNDWRLVAPLNGEFSSVIQRVSEVPATYVVIGKS